MDCRVGGSCLDLDGARSGKVIVEEPGMNSWSSVSSAPTFDILGMTAVEMQSLGGTDGGEPFRCSGLNGDRLGKPPKSSRAGGGFEAEKVWTLFLFQSGNEKKLWDV